jgi:hypothetical protein
MSRRSKGMTSSKSCRVHDDPKKKEIFVSVQEVEQRAPGT